MTQMTESLPAETSAEPDLVAALHRVLAASPEPLTLSKIRSHLPSPFRTASLEDLAEALRRQVAANVLHQYPKYRSQQDRFWDRPMPVHIAALVRSTLEEGPLAWSDLRRKLPGYAVPQAEAAVNEQVAQGLLYRHPPASKRGGERFGVQPPDPKDYLRAELTSVFRRLAQMGFTQAQLREGALELLHEEEWSLEPEEGRVEEGTSEEAPGAAAAPQGTRREQPATPPSVQAGVAPAPSAESRFEHSTAPSDRP